MGVTVSSGGTVEPEDYLFMGQVGSPLDYSSEGQNRDRDLGGRAAHGLPTMAVDLHSVRNGRDHHSRKALNLSKSPGCGARSQACQGNGAEPVLGHHELSAETRFKRRWDESKAGCSCYCGISPTPHIEGRIQSVLTGVLCVDPSHQDRHGYGEGGREYDRHARYHRFQACVLDDDRARSEGQPSHPPQPKRAARRDYPVPPVHGRMIARCVAYSQATEARV